jgi:UbiD family decarboxylase
MMTATDPRTEAMADLREFLRQADAGGELQRVDGASTDGEIGILFDLANMHRYPPVLLFENIPGYDPRFRILSNVRTAKLLVGELTLEAVKAYRKRPKGKSEPIPPQFVDDGPVFENVVEGAAVDLRRYPAPKWHPHDGGPYIGTECVVIMEDPQTGWVNAGTYRVMVHDEKTLGIFIDTGKHGDFIRRKYWAAGKACPVVISVGQAPILGIAGATSMNVGESELAMAGGRIGRPIRLVRGKTTGLPIPADAELVFEGLIPPPEEELRPEGPFGEWPGYYASDSRPEPVVRVAAVYHRNDPLLIGQAPLTPVHPGQQPKISRIAGLWDALEAAGVPGITGVWKVLGGGSRFITAISIKQLFPGHAKMAGLVAAGCREGAYMTRLIAIVDEDIDVTVPAEVMWALATRWDPKTQTDIIDGCWTGHIDPALSPAKRESGDITTSRMICYAVRPFAWKDQFPVANTLSKEDTAGVRAKWAGKLPFIDALHS